LIITSYCILLLIQIVFTYFDSFLRRIKHRILSHHLRGTCGWNFPLTKLISICCSSNLLIAILNLIFHAFLDFFCRALLLTDGRCDDDLALFSCYSTYIFAYLLNLVIESPLLSKVSNFIFICFLLEIVSFILSERLPLLPNLLHYLQRTHLWMCVYYLRPCLLNKNHIG
jgi:hypothetical protein